MKMVIAGNPVSIVKTRINVTLRMSSEDTLGFTKGLVERGIIDNLTIIGLRIIGGGAMQEIDIPLDMGVQKDFLEYVEGFGGNKDNSETEPSEPSNYVSCLVPVISLIIACPRCGHSLTQEGAKCEMCSVC